ncbi:DUF2809 domain-containing protein [Hymenobacter sp. DH14]|uniref:DUF2809 domain-containing protein n=1 Tax=Hymenobacter cyanobacteriorum TaxID=2926463 RepID=A0A9X1VGA6_9BACT|nr:DUF2809 domain-containing protein [Hymenobacter cyanobacteriorum]MCI1187607.1 DUF2809 domain-containing protein [Hymenobacter cyanobacteriorum]
MFRLHKTYLLAATLLLLLEIYIAGAVHDAIIRPYAGDLLAVIFLFCFASSFLTAPPRRVLLAVLGIAYLLEGLQYVHLLALLGLEHSRLARLVLGSRFAWGDMLAYSLGAVFLLAVAALHRRLRPPVA